MNDNILDNTHLDPEKSYLTELVGEGKKFKTVEDMAYGKAQSDAYVKLLERQLDQIKLDYQTVKTEAESRARLEDLVDKMNRPSTPNPYVPAEPPKTEINMSEIESFVTRKIEQTETERKQKANLEMVRSKLSERFGDNLETHLKEVGLDGESAARLAKDNPQIVLKALGIDKPLEPNFSTPPRNTSVNTPNKVPQQRTWSYYQEIFKANPSLKLDRNTNVQMMKDYASQGASFEDGDFNRFDK